MSTIGSKRTTHWAHAYCKIVAVMRTIKVRDELSGEMKDVQIQEKVLRCSSEGCTYECAYSAISTSMANHQSKTHAKQAPKPGAVSASMMSMFGLDTGHPNIQAKMKGAAKHVEDFSKSGACGLKDLQARFFSNNVAFKLIGDPCYYEQFPPEQLPLMHTNRNTLPTLILDTKKKVTSWQLKRMESSFGKLSTDSGTTRGTRFLPVFYQPNSHKPILLAMLNCADLRDGRLTGDEINRVLYFYTTLLKNDYDITVVHWAMDNAANMQAIGNDNVPNLTAEEIQQLEDSDFYNSTIDDPLYPSKADALNFNAGQIRMKHRDTCHALQLIFRDFEKSQHFVNVVKPAVDRLVVLHNIAIKNPAINKQQRDCMRVINWGSETRWWSWFNAVEQIHDDITSHLQVSSGDTAVVGATVKILEKLKKLSDLAESPASTMWDTTFIFSELQTLGNNAIDPNDALCNAIKSAVRSRLDWIATDPLCIVAYFAPQVIWKVKDNIAIETLGGDWIAEKLLLTFGKEVAEEFANFRFYVGATPQPIQRLALVLKGTAQNYETFWTRQFGQLYPKLTAAVLGLLKSGHTEIDCERVFSQNQGLVNKLRCSLSALSVHSCLALRNNWVIHAYTAANCTPLKKMELRRTEPEALVDIINHHLMNSNRFSEQQFDFELDNNQKTYKQFFEKSWEPLILGGCVLKHKNRRELREVRKETRRGERVTKLKNQLADDNKKHADLFEQLKAANKLSRGQLDAGPTVVNENFYACTTCGRLTVDHDDTFGTRENLDVMFECSKCKSWVHGDCMGFGVHMYSRFEIHHTWLCLKCRPTKAPVAAAITIDLVEDDADAIDVVENEDEDDIFGGA
jgi:hypothetical protein